jgi:hypothetical protein
MTSFDLLELLRGGQEASVRSQGTVRTVQEPRGALTALFEMRWQGVEPELTQQDRFTSLKLPDRGRPGHMCHSPHIMPDSDQASHTAPPA